MLYILITYAEASGILAIFFVVYTIAIIFDYRRERILDTLKKSGFVLLGGVGISILWLPFIIWWIRATYTPEKSRT